MGASLQHDRVDDADASVSGVGSWVSSHSGSEADESDIGSPPKDCADVEEEFTLVIDYHLADHDVQQTPVPTEPAPECREGEFGMSWVIDYSKQQPGRLLDKDDQKIPLSTETTPPSLTQQDTLSTRSGNPETPFPVRQGRYLCCPDPSQHPVTFDCKKAGNSVFVSEQLEEHILVASPAPSSSSSDSDYSASPISPPTTPLTEPASSADSSEWEDYESYSGNRSGSSSPLGSATLYLRSVPAAPEADSNAAQPDVSRNTTWQDRDENRTISNKSRKKRSREETAGDHGKDQNQVDINQVKRIKTEDQHQSLACPFYKHDPIRHRRCHTYVMKRISYVKQHLQRNHQQPIHCMVCMAVFDDEDRLFEHTRAQSCEMRPRDQRPDGMTPRQQKQLAVRANQKKNEAEQWYEIYSMLFPGADRPSSPYVNRALSEDMSSFREFVEGQGGKMIQDSLIKNLSGATVEEDLLRSLVHSAIQNIFPQWMSYNQGQAGSETAGEETEIEADIASPNTDRTEGHSDTISRRSTEGHKVVEIIQMEDALTTSTLTESNNGIDNGKDAGNTGTASSGTQTGSSGLERKDEATSPQSTETWSGGTTPLAHLPKA
ncbi:hypothetical protein AK830_g11970 [Neonectria ditissima]|uniref:C2H2-type domain-containing protein n=1 Tax=Neonectria ditissima TaxID=78410 RepID=A0A0P7B023_9HYPO|nr:hypothetical protein AK830_g11970 [Neonectria ditissima]